MGEKEGPPASGPAAAPGRGIVLVRGDITPTVVTFVARDHGVYRDALGDKPL